MGEPTEDEEFEMMYQQEMDMMNEMNQEELPFEPPDMPTQKSPGPAKPAHNVQNTPALLSQHKGTASQLNGRSFFQQSPALSQISFNNDLNDMDDEAGPSSAVNRRLFGTPFPTGRSRIASTPFAPATTSSQNPSDALNEIGMQNMRKRRLEDLFGDIRDIEEEQDVQMFAAIAKKMRSEEEIDLDMIEKILEKRKILQAEMNPLKNTNLDRLEALHKFKMNNLSYSVPKYPFMTIKRSDSERIYVRAHSEEFEKKQIDDLRFANRHVGGLLGQAREEIWSKAQAIINARLTAGQRAPAIVEDLPPIDTDGELWVEKYKPKKYLDLLSDESTNRSLLSWLKMWDKIVFNREFKADKLKEGPANSFNKKTGKFEAFGRFRKKPANNLKTDVDDLGRPIQKVALLCGPPGLGKTTLAHTIARHAGYAVREINASDDRSPEAFRTALENGTQMQSVLSQDKRPNCIVLDEIDGAPQPTIDFLIKFISDTATAKDTKKAKAKAAILRRPIICICNDMYAPALRSLRQSAFVVNFPPIGSDRLSERLMRIARREHLRTDLTSLLALAEKTGNDIRSCLSMLQFFGNQQKPLTLIDVLKSNIGQKDRHKSLFGIWGAIFQIQRPRKTLADDVLVADQQVVSMTDMSIKTRMRNILDVVHMGGDYERLMNGVHENYLTQKMPDPNMNGVAEATDWFCFSDRLRQHINHTQNYSVYAYQQFGFVAWHFLFASLVWPKINFPSQGFEFAQKTTMQKMIHNSLRKGFAATAIGVGEGATIVLDTIPLLRRVLAPNLRSVSLQLLTLKERADLRHAVEVMADLGLVYVQSKSMDGMYQYQLEPDINSLGLYEGVSVNHPLSYSGRQIIAREVELEKMRRAAPKSGQSSGSKSSAPVAKKNSKAPALPNHLQKLRPQVVPAKFKETVTKDFFGRMSSKQTSITVQEGGTDVIVKSPIWYRYKEGCNNAVRKDVTISNLLQ